MKRRFLFGAALLAAISAPANAYYEVSAAANANHILDGGPIVNSLSQTDAFATYSDGGGYSLAQAYADLGTGILRASSELTADSGFFTGFAGASFVDTLNFDLPDGVSSADVTFQFDVDGFLFPPISGQVPFGGLTGFMFVNGHSESAVTSELGDFDRLLSYTLTVFEGVPVEVTYGLTTSCIVVASSRETCTADMFNTGRANLLTPIGVAYSSDSGVFLADREVPVPEPQTAVLFGIGLFGMMLRRSSSRSRQPMPRRRHT